MQEIVKELLVKWECDCIEFGGESDHVHILFEAHPSVELSKLVNNLKTVTSRKLRSEYAQHLSQFYWGAKPHSQWPRQEIVLNCRSLLGGNLPFA